MSSGTSQPSRAFGGSQIIEHTGLFGLALAGGFLFFAPAKLRKS